MSATQIPTRGTTGAYGLQVPTTADARTAVTRAFGATAEQVWAGLTAAAGLSGLEDDLAAVERLVTTMSAAGDPVLRLCGRSLRIRLDSHARLSAAYALTHPRS